MPSSLAVGAQEKHPEKHAARAFASITAVQRRVQKLLQPALDAAPFWIRAELSSVKRSGQNLYCDLVELRGGRVVAKMRATIWSSDLFYVEAKLKDAKLDNLLADGNEVGIKCRVHYHELYGLSVSVVDIDPSESLGALERKRAEILRKLHGEKLLDKNKERHLAALPQRIGLLASTDTAGYRDFLATLQSSQFSFRVFEADARMEGEQVESSVCRALDCLAQLPVDVVVILRGGGSRLSLSYLDNEKIARRIANLSHPVWTAIGHEIDDSVLDRVASQSFKTPTAVAEHLLSRMVQAEEWCARARVELERRCRDRLDPERDWIDGAPELLVDLARRRCETLRANNLAKASQFRFQVQKRLTREDTQRSKDSSRLISAATQRRLIAKASLEEHRKSLSKTVTRNLAHKREAQSHRLERLLSQSVPNRLHAHKRQLASWHQVLRAADPMRNLERGYALVYNQEGKLVRKSSELEAGMLVQTELADGKFASRVVSRQESSKAAKSTKKQPKAQAKAEA